MSQVQDFADAANKLASAIRSGDEKKAIAACPDFFEACADVTASPAAGASGGATTSAQDRQAAQQALSDLTSACQQAQSRMSAATSPRAGAWGDGSFLSHLADFITKMLPIIMPFLVHGAGGQQTP